MLDRTGWIDLDEIGWINWTVPESYVSFRQAHPSGSNQTDYAHSSARAPPPALAALPQMA